MRRFFNILTALCLGYAAQHLACAEASSESSAIISIADQKMRVLRGDQMIREFPVSTSKFGLGDRFNSYRTPLGRFEVAQRIGHNVPIGGKFYRRNFTGIVYNVRDSSIEKRERDSILSRIIWLRGLDPQNQNAYHRGIYIHGTNQESSVGKPVSYGCIRMKNSDVVEVFELLPEGSKLVIQVDPLPKAKRQKRDTSSQLAATSESSPALPPVVASNATLVASASERGAKSPTILRADDGAANPFSSNTAKHTESSTATSPLPTTHHTNATRPAVLADVAPIEEGWSMDQLAQREANTRSPLGNRVKQ